MLFARVPCTSGVRSCWLLLAATLVCVLLFGMAALRQYASFASAAVERELTMKSLSAAVRLANERRNRLTVAVFDDEQEESDSTRELIQILDSELHFKWKLTNSRQICTGGLDEVHVIIFPGGNAKQQAATLGEEGKRAVRQFVNDGGGYVGICAGAFLATCYAEWSLSLIDAHALTGEVYVTGKGMVPMSARNAGTVRIDFTSDGNGLFHETAKSTDVRYSGGPILSPAQRSDLPDYVTLAVYRTEVWDIEPQRGTMINTPAIIASQYGKGSVVLTSPHVEMTDGLDALTAQLIFAVTPPNELLQ